MQTNICKLVKGTIMILGSTKYNPYATQIPDNRNVKIVPIFIGCVLKLGSLDCGNAPIHPNFCYAEFVQHNNIFCNHAIMNKKKLIILETLTGA